MRRRSMAGHPAVTRTTLVRPQPSQLRSSFLGRLTAGSSALNRRMRGSNPARGARRGSPTCGRGHGVQAVSNAVGEGSIPSVRAYMPRSSSRTGCRSLTPVMRVRVPPGVSMRPWCQCRKHAALPASQTGFESRRSLFTGLLVARMVACNHPSGVRFPGAPCQCSRTRLVARLGCLPGEAGSTPAESAPRRSSADPSATLRGWGTEVRILPARYETTTTGRLGRRRSDTAVERGSIPRSSISP